MEDEIIIVDDSGTEHVFPAGFDPKKAASIVKSRVSAAPATTPAPAQGGLLDRAATSVAGGFGYEDYAGGPRDTMVNRVNQMLVPLAQPKTMGDLSGLLLPNFAGVGGAMAQAGGPAVEAVGRGLQRIGDSAKPLVRKAIAAGAIPTAIFSGHPLALLAAGAPALTSGAGKAVSAVGKMLSSAPAEEPILNRLLGISSRPVAQGAVADAGRVMNGANVLEGEIVDLPATRPTGPVPWGSKEASPIVTPPPASRTGIAEHAADTFDMPASTRTRGLLMEPPVVGEPVSSHGPIPMGTMERKGLPGIQQFDMPASSLPRPQGLGPAPTRPGLPPASSIQLGPGTVYAPPSSLFPSIPSPVEQVVEELMTPAHQTAKLGTPRVVSWKPGMGPSPEDVKALRATEGSKATAARLKIPLSKVKEMTAESKPTYLPQAARDRIAERVSTLDTPEKVQAYLDAAPNDMTRNFIEGLLKIR